MEKDSSSTTMKTKLLDDPSFSVEQCYSEKDSLEEKISNVLLLLSSIDGIPDIEALLNSVKLQKSNILSLYDLLSSSIRSELVNNLDELFELKLNSSKLEKKMDQLLYSIRISSPFGKNMSDDKLPKSEEYRQFLSLYGENIEITQNIVKLKSKVSLLLDSQKILDKNYASKMAYVDYQIISLGRIINNLTEASREEIGELYMTQFNRIDELINDISEREEKFNRLRQMMKLNPENFIYNGFNKNIIGQIDELESIQNQHLV